MAVFTFTGADNVRMTEFFLGFLKDLVVDENTATKIHWAKGSNAFTLTGTDLQATVVGGKLTDLTGGTVTGLFEHYKVDGTPVDIAIYNLTLDAVSLYDLIVGKDWKGILALTTAGRDEIHGTSGKDLLKGGGAGDMVLGMNGADKLLGGRGNDTLDGGNGADTLVGGRGADQFVFAAEIGRAVDQISDFKPGEDSFQLWRGFFDDIGTRGHLGARFEIGSEASLAGVRVIYDFVTGDVSYDQDGSGTGHAAVVFAHLDAGLALTGHDFTLVN